MWCGIISLFPDMFHALKSGITGRALKHGLLSLDFWNPRDFAPKPYQRVDDKPYGGGPGMVMMVKPLLLAIQAAKKKSEQEARVICMSPQGKKITQTDVTTLANTASQRIIFVSGRYEGIDERVYNLAIDEEWSIGDYILTGGELAVMVAIDAMTRFIPGALGHKSSAMQDSFFNGLLDFPHYTRPKSVEGAQAPDILLCGNHAAIKAWRLQQQLKRTWLHRPDLIANRQLSKIEKKIVDQLIQEGKFCEKNYSKN